MILVGSHRNAWNERDKNSAADKHELKMCSPQQGRELKSKAGNKREANKVCTNTPKHEQTHPQVTPVPKKNRHLNYRAQKQQTHKKKGDKINTYKIWCRICCEKAVHFKEMPDIS